MIDKKRYRSIMRRDAGKAAEYDQRIEVPLFDFGAAGAGPEGLSPALRVTLMDQDWLTSDDVLGSGLKELAEVLAGGQEHVTWPLLARASKGLARAKQPIRGLGSTAAPGPSPAWLTHARKHAVQVQAGV